MKFRAGFFVFLALALGMPLCAANFEVSTDLNSLDLVVEKSADDQVHIIKNFDEAYFEYSENITGNRNSMQYITLVSKARVGVSVSRSGRAAYYNSNTGNMVVMADKPKVVVQVPDGGIIIAVSGNGGITVNSVDCEILDIRTINGGIDYTGKIEGQNISFHTTHGDINITLEKESEFDVDLQIWYKHDTLTPDTGISGVTKHGNSIGRITSKNGRGLINMLTRDGKINWDLRS